MAPIARIELATNRLTADCSTTELYWQTTIIDGGRREIRTLGWRYGCVYQFRHRPLARLRGTRTHMSLSDNPEAATSRKERLVAPLGLEPRTLSM